MFCLTLIDSLMCMSSALEELSLRGNKVTVAPSYRGFTKHLIASLKILDGKPLYQKDGNRCPGYGVRYSCMNNMSDGDAETVMTTLNSHLSVSSGPSVPPAAAHVSIAFLLLLNDID